ncbi:unnamed protein product [Mortierella alpina]
MTRATKHDIEHPFSATPRLSALSKAVASYIDRIVGSSAREIMLYIDGADCNEKQQARRIRGTRVAKAVIASINAPAPCHQPDQEVSFQVQEARVQKTYLLKTFRFDPSLKIWLASSNITDDGPGASVRF